MGKTNNSGKKSQEVMVVTPGGLRPRQNVHLIEAGHHLSGKDGVFRKIHSATGVVVKEFGPINQGKANRRSLRKIKKALPAPAKMASPQPISDQWIIFSGWTNNSGVPISYFTTEWVVPNAPESQDNQLIYLFNGIENAANNVILQPVLQWGVSPIGGGNYWAVANWYVGAPGSGLAFHGPLIPVNIGDKLQGVMSLTGQNAGAFNYLSSFNGLAADLPVTDVGELVWAVETLECYGLTQFSDYPNMQSTVMSGIEIKLGNAEAAIQWDAYNAVTDNGQHCNIASNASPGGEVDLCYT